MGGLALSLLGSFQATFDGTTIASFESDRARALLAYLAIEVDRPHRRESLTGLLWPDWPDASALTNLRNSLANLRKAIGDRDAATPAITASRETLQFNPAAEVWVDVLAFRIQTAPDQPIARQEEGIALYRGPFLEGFGLKDSPALDEWLQRVRDQLQRQCLAALERVSVHYEQAGNLAQALAVTLKQVDLAPWQEEAHRRLMRLLALNGQRSAALAQYETCRRVLQKELGVEPSPETTTLYERIRAGELRGSQRMDAPVPTYPSLLRKPDLPTWLNPFVGRADQLEEIRSFLKDPSCRLLTLVGPGGSGKTRLAVEAASRQAAAYPDGVFFVSLTPLESAHSIPSAIARCLGCEGEGDPRQQVLDYLREKTVLLVLDNFENLLEGANLAVEILQTAPRVKVLVTSRVRLNVQAETLLPVSGMSYPEALPATMEEAQQYSGIKLFLETARRANPSFKASQEDLVEITDICRKIEGLPLAILLAAAWVRMLTPAEIAAEIAAGSLDFLEGRSQDMPERQRSLRAVFDSSWRLLSERARQLFSGLCVFRAGFTLTAAQQVCGATLRELVSLMDQSMLERTPAGRYEIHELLRKYGEEKLVEPASGSPDGKDPRDQHAAYYTTALRRWEMEFKGPRQLQVLAEMEQEIANIQAAWRWAALRGQVQWLADGMMGLGYFYRAMWRYPEGQLAFDQATMGLAAAGDRTAAGAGVLATLMAWQSIFDLFMAQVGSAGKRLPELKKLLDSAEQAGQDVRRYRAFYWSATGIYHKRTTDLEAAKTAMFASLGLWRELDERWEVIFILSELEALFEMSGDFQACIRYAQESLVLCKELGLPLETINNLSQLTNFQSLPSQFIETIQLMEECIEQCRSLGLRRKLVTVLLSACLAYRNLEKYELEIARAEEAVAINLHLGSSTTHPMYRIGEANTFLGRCEPARIALVKCLPGFEKEGNRWGIGATNWKLGIVAVLEDRWIEARQFLLKSRDLFHQIKFSPLLGQVLADLGIVEQRLGHADAARTYMRESLLFAVKTKARVASYFLTAAAYIAANSDPERAVELQNLASRSFYEVKTARFELIRAEIAKAALALPPAVIAAAEQRGREIDLDATLQEMLGEFGAIESSIF